MKAHGVILEIMFSNTSKANPGRLCIYSMGFFPLSFMCVCVCEFLAHKYPLFSDHSVFLT